MTATLAGIQRNRMWSPLDSEPFGAQVDVIDM